MFRLLLICALLGCATIDLHQRPRWPDKELCLVVNITENSWTRDDVVDAAKEWNDRLGESVFHVAPNCSPHNELVTWSFLRELPDDCHSYYSCTFSRVVVKGKPSFRETVVQEDAPFSSLIHEMGHLVGCSHRDLDSPCQKGILQ